MGKTGKWLKNFLTGKKEKDKDKVIHHEPVPSPPNKTESGSVPAPSPKEKRRWSFRRSKELNTGDVNGNILNYNNGVSEDDTEKTKQVVAVAAAITLAADKIEAETEEEAAAKTTSVNHGRKKSMYVEDEAAVKIQANYRAYLARKALCALRGLVKLQALIRGHLVRMQATETLRRMQALVAAQERARVERIQMVEEVQSISYRTPNHRRSPQHPRFQQSYEMEKYAEENIKIVEMDIAEPRIKTKGRNSYSSPQSYSTSQSEGLEHRHSLYYYGSRTPSKSDIHCNYSPCPSALTDINPIGHSGRFEEFSFKTAQSSPQYYSAVPNGSTDYPFFPNYMSNTKSSRAKARSQSAPRQRHESYERQSSRRRHVVEGRNIPRGVKMQRSSSQVGLPIIGHQFPWHLKLGRSSVSARDSECGSNSSVLTNNNYCRSLATYELYGNKY